jgi:hypothetical protein
VRQANSQLLIIKDIAAKLLPDFRRHRHVNIQERAAHVHRSRTSYARICGLSSEPEKGVRNLLLAHRRRVAERIGAHATKYSAAACTWRPIVGQTNGPRSGSENATPSARETEKRKKGS